MKKADFDLCVIGGGINGAGIARDAAGRGASVLLLEQGDLAGATSSASTKLIHGGLRYLEHYEFRLVREALEERETLLDLAPHIISPLTFILPHDKSLRPTWMIRAGLFLYDRLGGRRRLEKSRQLDLRRHHFGAPLQDRYSRGFSYSDCWVDDARLVVLNALDAQQRGATILTRTKCSDLRPSDSWWEITATNSETGADTTYTARSVINSAGPWVRDLLDENNLAGADTPKVRHVKGSHIIVPRMFPGSHAYILQQPDKRIVFAIPYEHDFTLVGTTDVEYTGDPAKVAIDQGEIDYLCAAVNRAFKDTITPADIVHSYSGVRPLLDDGEGEASAVTRDYSLIRDDQGEAALLSVFGGKITTYRHLAEDAVTRIWGGKPWTGSKPLPGGDIEDFTLFMEECVARYPWLPPPLLERYAHQYGTMVDTLLLGKSSLGDLGREFGAGLYEAEITYLARYEWAQTAEDILWRRTKLGLSFSPNDVHSLQTALNDIRKGMTL